MLWPMLCKSFINVFLKASKVDFIKDDPLQKKHYRFFSSLLLSIILFNIVILRNLLNTMCQYNVLF